MKSYRLPEGLYDQWLKDYKKKYPDHNDVWHKYTYLHARTTQYLNAHKKTNKNR
tara:strand:+ start:389 stop:550 length:162 start_codon:yes stop_codon:yes gene_type:complete